MPLPRWLSVAAAHVDRLECLTLAASYGLPIERHEVNVLIPLGVGDRAASADRLLAMIAADGARRRRDRLDACRRAAADRRRREREKHPAAAPRRRPSTRDTRPRGPSF